MLKGFRKEVLRLSGQKHLLQQDGNLEEILEKERGCKGTDTYFIFPLLSCRSVLVKMLGRHSLEPFWLQGVTPYFDPNLGESMGGVWVKLCRFWPLALEVLCVSAFLFDHHHGKNVCQLTSFSKDDERHKELSYPDSGWEVGLSQILQPEAELPRKPNPDQLNFSQCTVYKHKWYSHAQKIVQLVVQQ